MDLSGRVTQLNDSQVNTKGRYVLYWMQMFKRGSHNYAHHQLHDIAKHGQEV